MKSAEQTRAHPSGAVRWASVSIIYNSIWLKKVQYYYFFTLFKKILKKYTLTKVLFGLK